MNVPHLNKRITGNVANAHYFKLAKQMFTKQKTVVLTAHCLQYTAELA